jgi:hypothetical protein
MKAPPPFSHFFQWATGHFAGSGILRALCFREMRFGEEREVLTAAGTCNCLAIVRFFPH